VVWNCWISLNEWVFERVLKTSNKLEHAVWEATMDHGRVAWQRAQALSTLYPNKITEFEDHFANVWHRNKLLLYHGR
jgi:hypothetical protein